MSRIDEMFYRLDRKGNAVILWTSGEPVTRIAANVYPVGSDLSARYEHPEGIVLSVVDAEMLGIEPER